jgi:hypothetical protein
MTVAMRKDQRTARRVPGTGTMEAAMMAFVKKGNRETAIIDFSAKWPLAFRVQMLTIPGLSSTIPITRRQP